MNGKFILSHFILLALLLCKAPALAQENPSSPEFPMGTYFSSHSRTSQTMYNTLTGSGLNTVVQYASDQTRPHLSEFNLIAYNQDHQNDWINHYATGYYSKWEAEENQTNPGMIGVKHQNGQQAQWNGKQCWSTQNVTAPAGSLMYGPHYTQAKNYRRSFWGSGEVSYTARFNMALDKNGVQEDEDVCRIYVRVRHIKYENGVEVGTFVDNLGYPVTIKAFEFPEDGIFKAFNYEYNYAEYRDYLSDQIRGGDNANSGTTYDDTKGNTGVEFCVEWLRSDNLCTLYIDNVEVYDNNGWSDYIIDTFLVTSRVQNYAQSFTSIDWPNLKCWYSQDEPQSLDSYTPMRIVDSLVYDEVGIHLVSSFFPNYNVLVNGDSQMVHYFREVNPEHLMIDYYPFTAEYHPIRPEKLEIVRNIFQLTSSIQDGFWYVAQTYGFKDSLGLWNDSRRPDSSELKAVVMLALAHGSKGIFFWNYDSYPVIINNVSGIYDCIVGSTDNNYAPSELYYLIRDNLTARLKSKLGNRLSELRYTGDYISKSHFPGEAPINQTTLHYLTIPYGLSSDSVNWHAGFFDRTGYSDDKYFFLVNLLPENEDSVGIRLAPPVAGYYNYRFRNYEGYFDTTFYQATNFTYVLHHPAGEGYLYEVAPVVKYGGKLYADETITNNPTLSDDMIIENGVTLTVNSNYTCDANIYLKPGAGIETTGEGNIILSQGKSIIIQGSATLTGTQAHNLTITGVESPDDNNIVVVNSTGSLTVNYCRFYHGSNAIKVFGGAGNLTVNNSVFEGQSNAGIAILGNLTYLPKIKYSSFGSSDNGIQAFGLSSIIIQHNSFTDNLYDVSLSQVGEAQVIDNILTNRGYDGQGLFFASTGGYIRKNEITGHQNGIYLANSSPGIGDNDIYENRFHGIYVGKGSQPDLRGYLVHIPCHNNNLYYPLRGYNNIYSNGQFDSNGGNDDGSEIYLSYANLLMDVACNAIVDDRTEGPEALIKNLISGKMD